MCGRLDQHHTDKEYAMAMGWADYDGCSEALPRYNAPPGTQRPLFQMDEGRRMVRDRFWGYQPSWAVGKIPPASNARMDKLTTRYWSALMRTGRTIVAADAWYEWTGEKPNKQPWRIHRKEGGILFIAALAGPGREDGATAASGFALVTSAAEGGLVDIHDRRPVVFTAEDAQLWLDPDLPAEQAEQLARSVALGPEIFAWHKVGKAIGNSRNESPSLAEPIEEAQEASLFAQH